MNLIAGAFKPPCNISISFADGRTRKQVRVKKENDHAVMAPLFQNQESIVGEVIIQPARGKKVEHNGVKIELLGQIELYFDRGNFYDFTSLGTNPKHSLKREIFNVLQHAIDLHNTEIDCTNLIFTRFASASSANRFA